MLSVSLPTGVSPATSPCQLTTPRVVSRASATATRLSVRPPPATLPRSSSHSSTQVGAAWWNLRMGDTVCVCVCVRVCACECVRACVCVQYLLSGVFITLDGY